MRPSTPAHSFFGLNGLAHNSFHGFHHYFSGAGQGQKQERARQGGAGQGRAGQVVDLEGPGGLGGPSGGWASKRIKRCGKRESLWEPLTASAGAEANLENYPCCR